MLLFEKDGKLNLNFKKEENRVNNDVVIQQIDSELIQPPVKLTQVVLDGTTTLGDVDVEPHKYKLSAGEFLDDGTLLDVWIDTNNVQRITSEQSLVGIYANYHWQFPKADGSDDAAIESLMLTSIGIQVPADWEDSGDYSLTISSNN